MELLSARMSIPLRPATVKCNFMALSTNADVAKAREFAKAFAKQ